MVSINSIFNIYYNNYNNYLRLGFILSFIFTQQLGYILKKNLLNYNIFLK